MRTIRYSVTIKGVEVDMLFTPRLFIFKSEKMNFSVGDGGAAKVAEIYADIMYCAALNSWTLDDHLAEDFPLKRIDIHEWTAQEPKEFGKIMKVAVEAITHKNLEDLLREGKEITAEDKTAENVKKKTSRSIMQRLRDSWLALVG
jgi:hypothetical protein